MDLTILPVIISNNRHWLGPCLKEICGIRRNKKDTDKEVSQHTMTNMGAYVTVEKKYSEITQVIKNSLCRSCKSRDK